MLSAYSKNKDAAAKLIKYMVSSETQKEHAIKLSRLPTLQALYEDKDVLAAQPVTGANYNKVSTTFFQTTNKILNGQVSVDEGVESMESKIKRDLR